LFRKYGGGARLVQRAPSLQVAASELGAYLVDVGLERVSVQGHGYVRRDRELAHVLAAESRGVRHEGHAHLPRVAPFRRPRDDDGAVGLPTALRAAKLDPLRRAHRRTSRTAHTALQSSGDALPMRTSCSATSNRSAIAELMRSARLPASMSGLGRASVWAVTRAPPDPCCR